MSLQIADGVSLPDDYVTKTAAICAQRRKGKTYTASVIAEELVRLGHPWVAFDPTSAWWGLRASADGKHPGLPVVIIGGDHGDLPLDGASGRFIADLVVDHPGWYVIDLSLLGTRAAERTFATDFADRLYRRKSSAQHRFPMHLFVDEADLFAPQDKEQGDNKMLGAFQAIVRRGGLLGLGCTLITQRPALLNKSVLTQLDLLILLRLVAGNDQDAVDKNYIQRAGSKEQRAELMGSLASMKVGEAWLWEPGAEPALFVRTKIRERHTFNSSATPKMGETIIEPTRLADVDLAAIKEQMAETIERAKADDPKALKAQITDLQRRLRDAQHALTSAPLAPEPVVERVEMPVLTGAQHAAVDILGGELKRVAELIDEVRPTLLDVLGRIDDHRQDVPRARPASAGAGPMERARPAQRPDPAPRREPHRPAVSRAAATEGDRIPGPQRKLLTVLATYGPRTKRQLALLAGYSIGGGAFNNPLGAIRAAGYVEPRKGEPMSITEEGLAALGDYEPLPQGAALLDHWLSGLPGPCQKLLSALADVWPESYTKLELAAVTGYEASGGAFNNPLGRLRTLELVTRGTDIRLTDDFGEAIQ